MSQNFPYYTGMDSRLWTKHTEKWTETIRLDVCINNSLEMIQQGFDQNR